MAWLILGCLGVVHWSVGTDLCSSGCLGVGPRPSGLLSSGDDKGVFLALKRWLRVLLGWVFVARLIAQFIMGSRVCTNFTLVKCSEWKSYTRKMLKGGVPIFTLVKMLGMGTLHA